ncbi:hypothetical protein [Singulisphaera sp. PoT]|uniref:hypothetical protein n=1 Tax=Singulisphaera sp. PoT TaxID=3411797 RepID=UPI003BF50471
MNPAQKLGIVLDSSKEPWEKGTGGYFRVIEDGGKFKMYYGAFLDSGHGLCYAESDNGLHWTKPALGLVEVGGSKANNVIYPDDAIDATIMVDSIDVPERRYKLFRSKVTDDPARAGVYASYSADGIHFTEAGRVLPMWPETSLIADWDSRIKKYVVFLRVFVRNQENQRRVGRIETDDLLKPWPFRQTDPLLSPPSPENIQAVLSVDEHDNPHSDLYTNAACLYPYAQDVYLMFPSVFRHFSPRQQPWFRFKPGNDDGMFEVQMAVSRDGITWERPDRRPYVPMGLPDEWDRWLAMMGVGMVRRGNSLYQYHWSSGRMHDSAILRPEYDQAVPPKSAIGALRQRVDGFMSADFAYGGGTLTTPPITFVGTHLRLNIDTGAMGTAFVEIRDERGEPIPGFTRADCEEIGGNFLDVPVRWKGKSDLTALRGRPISLHITARSAKLYAFQFPADPPPSGG